MEHKLIKYNRYDLKTCECCKREVDTGYNFTDMNLCSECFYTLRRGINPDYLNKNTLKEYLREVEFQRNYFKTYCPRTIPYLALSKMYDNDFTHNASLKPVKSFAKNGEEWVETEETPLLLYDVQQFGVMVFENFIRIISKTEPVMLNLVITKAIGDPVFVHTSESDITKGNMMLSFCAPQLYKADGKVVSEILMGRIIGLKDAVRTIISQKCDVKFSDSCSSVKDLVYFEAFAQAIKDLRILGDINTCKEFCRTIYLELSKSASRYQYNIELDKYDEETKRKFYEYRNKSHNTGSQSSSSEKTGTMDNAKSEALRFFGLGNYYSLKDLRKKRNELLKKYHPDNAGTNMEKYSDYSHKTQMINIYYELLEKEVS